MESTYLWLLTVSIHHEIPSGHTSTHLPTYSNTDGVAIRKCFPLLKYKPKWAYAFHCYVMTQNICMCAWNSQWFVLFVIPHHLWLNPLLFPAGVPHSGAHVTGSGFVARLLRSIVDTFTIPLARPAPSLIPCLPEPYPPDFRRYTQIGMWEFRINGIGIKVFFVSCTPIILSCHSTMAELPLHLKSGCIKYFRSFLPSASGPEKIYMYSLCYKLAFTHVFTDVYVRLLR